MEQVNEIADRILEFLKVKEISSGALADRIGVQRSSISHILSGRNRPGFEFIRKFIEAFPEVNAEWFIAGRGNMLKVPVQKGLFDTEATTETENTAKDPENHGNLPQEEDKAQAGTHLRDEDEVPYITRKTAQKGKIVQVILLYEDGKFVSYDPE
jgi:transcriptional regulator with XRE-family HTH domain